MMTRRRALAAGGGAFAAAVTASGWTALIARADDAPTQLSSADTDTYRAMVAAVALLPDGALIDTVVDAGRADVALDHLRRYHERAAKQEKQAVSALLSAVDERPRDARFRRRPARKNLQLLTQLLSAQTPAEQAHLDRLAKRASSITKTSSPSEFRDYLHGRSEAIDAHRAAVEAEHGEDVTALDPATGFPRYVPPIDDPETPPDSTGSPEANGRLLATQTIALVSVGFPGVKVTEY